MRGDRARYDLFSDVRYALRWLRRSPGVHAGRHRLAGDRHRLQHRALHARRRAAVPAAAGRAPRPPRRRLHAAAATAISTRRASYPDLLDFKAQNQVFTDMLAYSPAIAAVKLTDRSRLAMGETVTGNYFQLLGVQRRSSAARCCRTTTGRARRAPSVISYRLWNREYGASPSAVGQSIRIHGQPYTIVGVAPQLVHRHGAAARAGSVDADGVRRRGRAGRHHQHRPVADRQHAARAPRHALDVREGTPEGGRDVRSGRGANMRLIGKQLQTAYIQTNKDREVCDAADEGRAHPSDRGSHAPADRVRPDVRRRPRPADCVRERGEHAAGARVRAPEGNRHPAGDRRQPPPARAAAAVGERRHGRRSAPRPAWRWRGR